MALKSAPFIRIKKSKKKRKLGDIGKLTTGAVTAIIGTALFTETANILRRL